ncbi:retrovirus-related pol polyprotein from transposon TNT 1-94 [Tanacetum coccineum]
MYDYWKSRMELYIENRENGRMILNSVLNGPLVWYTIIEENGTTRTKKYEELSVAEKLQADCDLKATNIVLQDDPIACLNKAMAFMSVVVASRFLLTNNQLRTSSYPRNQATIQDDKFTVQQVQGRQGQSYVGTGYKGNATSSGGNNVGGHARIVTCYNCQGEVHMARQCTQPKRPMNTAWFKEKEMLAEAHESGQILDEEQLAFLADPGIPYSQAAQTTIPNNAAFQTEDLDAYDSDCDDVSTAQAVLMANYSNYGSDVISEVPHSEPYHNDMDNQSVHVMQNFEKTPVVDFTDNEITKLSAEQAFWLQTSHHNTDQSDISPVKIDAPRELSKVSLVNTSLKKLKCHLGKFDTVVKKRITPDAITEREWGFEHTKAVFLNEIIPFLKTLKDIFNVFDKDLLNEDKSYNNQNALEFLEYFENNDLKAQLQAKNTTICKLKEHIKSMRENNKEEKVRQKMDEIETINIELEQSEHCDSLIAQLNSKSMENMDLKGQIQEKVFVITSLKNDLQKLKGKNVLNNATTITNTTTIAPGMFKLHLDPLALRLLKNRDAHIDYIKYTHEQADILQGIVKQAKAKQPLDNALDFAWFRSCTSRSHYRSISKQTTRTSLIHIESCKSSTAELLKIDSGRISIRHYKSLLRETQMDGKGYALHYWVHDVFLQYQQSSCDSDSLCIDMVSA